jgi:hypothetical protein
MTLMKCTKGAQELGPYTITSTANVLWLAKSYDKNDMFIILNTDFSIHQ